MNKKASSKVKLGKLSHIGVVVRDIDKAIEYYTSVFGLGPFTTEVYDLRSFIYRGQTASARVKAAIAYSGSVFIELVQVLEGETVHTEFLRERGEGLQHVAFLVRNLDETLKELARCGIEPVMQLPSMTIPAIATPGNPQPGAARNTRMQLTEVYLNSDKVGGVMIQLMEFKQLPAD
ncbi:MAG: hypothetical protein FJ012_10565 [Chloroflexi bacterium]|nr:hypothetical protein [Chloroflexota bacterium]